MDIDPIDFFPGCEQHYSFRQRSRCTNFTNICTHLLAMAFAVTVCVGTFFYYDLYIRNDYNSLFNKDSSKSLENMAVEKITKDMEKLKTEIENTNIWRKHLNELFSKIYLEQGSIIENKIEKALDVYDSDKIEVFDYASVYACASIVSTPDTLPYPANKSINFFNLLNVDIMSNPEQMLQPNNLPGNCFAFYGTTGRIRIKLGSKITIRAVTLDHIKLLEDASSAPKDFEVYGLNDPFDLDGIFLGRFVYSLEGRPYQTFKITENFIDVPFEYVELIILSNHGRRDFTCVYRFRVHNTYPQEPAGIKQGNHILP